MQKSRSNESLVVILALLDSKAAGIESIDPDSSQRRIGRSPRQVTAGHASVMNGCKAASMFLVFKTRSAT